MVEWLAVVAFCASGRCAFWAGTDELFPTEEACIKKVAQAEDYLVKEGATATMPVCLPIKWQGKRV